MLLGPLSGSLLVLVQTEDRTRSDAQQWVTANHSEVLWDSVLSWWPSSCPQYACEREAAIWRARSLGLCFCVKLFSTLGSLREFWNTHYLCPGMFSPTNEIKFSGEESWLWCFLKSSPDDFNMRPGLRGSLVAQTLKNPSAVQETRVRSLGQEDPVEEGMATHFSVLVWRIPWTEEPGGI